MVVEALGGWHHSAILTLKGIAKCISIRESRDLKTATNYLMNSLSVALQKLYGAMLAERCQPLR